MPHDVWDNKTKEAWDLGNVTRLLVPRSIPLMEESPVRLSRVRQSSGAGVPSSFPREHTPIQIPARTRARLLLDQDYLVTAYPELTVKGGAGATLTLRYAEGAVAPGQARQGHRVRGRGAEVPRRAPTSSSRTAAGAHVPPLGGAPTLRGATVETKDSRLQSKT